MPTVTKFKFEFELPACLAETITETEGRPCEEVLSDVLAEVVRCKTHFEAKMVLRGKHKTIKQTPKNMERARRVHEELESDQIPEIPTKKFKVKVTKK
jgi:hypothetical protein